MAHFYSLWCTINIAVIAVIGDICVDIEAG